MANETNDYKDDLFRSCDHAGCTLRVARDGTAVEQLTPSGWVRLKITPGMWRDEYARIRLRGRKSAPYTVMVHRLVVMAWSGPPPSPAHRIVEHRDGIRLRNDADNVAWATYSSNLHSAIRLGERPRFAPRVLDEHTVYRIRKHRSRAELAAIADEYGTGEQTVRDVFDFHTWRHVRLDQPRLF